ncbi:MAG: nucleoside-diphosphate sugar epimerase/dehydratase [Elusimicrobiota bacterium]|nr:nucleoside-diphosphate sugar epimerase/dehydratase [Elusimicrobiota bacterium]
MPKLRKPILILIDLAIINLTVYLALLLRWDWSLPEYVKLAYISLAPLITIVRLICFYAFGMYQWTFRYAGIQEAINIWKATTLGTFAFITIVFIKQYTFLGRSIPIIDYFLCFFFVSASRLFPRLVIRFREQRRSVKNLKRTVIIGAGSTGGMVAKELIEKKELYQPVGFIDDDPAKRSLWIQGLKVLGTTREIQKIVDKYQIEEVIIAIPSTSGKIVRDIIAKCEAAGVKFKIVPAVRRILSGEVSIKFIRDVQPEDLLGREVISVNTDEIKSLIQSKSVLITGAGGTIGSELSRQVASFSPSRLILNDNNENEIYFLEIELKKKFPSVELIIVIGDAKDIITLKDIFAYKPQIVFHAAAYKHVPLMERNICAAIKNNIITSRNLIYAASHYKAEKFVLISTDKAVNPTSVMGATKRVAEMLLQAKSKCSKTKFMSVRFGNVIGSSGSVVPLFKKQIEEGGPITVTHPEIKRYFMTVSEAVELVLQAAAFGTGGETFILDMGEQIKIIDLARDLIVLSGLKPDKDIAIEFSGLRPGEKLYEEVLHDAETDRATKHNKIFIAQADNFDTAKLHKDIRELEELVASMAEDKIIQKLKEMVPSYSPPNSY